MTLPWWRSAPRTARRAALSSEPARCRRGRRRPCRGRGRRGSGLTCRRGRAWAPASRARRAWRRAPCSWRWSRRLAGGRGGRRVAGRGCGGLLVRRRRRLADADGVVGLVDGALQAGLAGRGCGRRRAAGVALRGKDREVRHGEDEHRGQDDHYGLGDLVHAPRIGAIRGDLSAKPAVRPANGPPTRATGPDRRAPERPSAGPLRRQSWGTR